MKIAHLIFSEQVAGAEKYLLELLPGLRSEGITCSLICVSPAKTKDRFVGFCNELNQNGIETIIFEAKRFNYLSVARKISKYLQKKNINYLHSHLLKSDLLAVLVKKFFNKKIFLLSTKHGYQEKYLTSFPVYKGRIVYNTYYFISKLLAKNINQHIAVSAAMAKLYYDLKITPQPVKYIHHGITISYKSEGGDIEKFRLASAQMIIVGRLEEMKGHRYLFDAMPAVIRQVPGVKLLVLGDGTQKTKLIKQATELGIENNVLFLGFQQNPYSYISQSDLIVLPSLFEPFGLVYIEAFALKIPVIAFDVPASNEIIKNNETGLLAPVLDIAVLADRIVHLLQNPQERKRISDNGYAEYTRYYNTARMVKEMVAWYRSVISEQ